MTPAQLPPRSLLAPSDGFDAFMRAAVTWPLLQAPFDEPAQRVLAAFEAFAARYALEPSPGGVLVSIVMPVRDCADVVGEAIACVRAQSHPSWELLIVDDGSTDDTLRVCEAQADERISVTRLPAARGVSAARNIGLDLAQGRYIAYLDADNLWHEDFLRITVARLEGCIHRLAYTAQEIRNHLPGKASPALDPAYPGDDAVIAVRFAPFNRALLENRNYIDLNAVVHHRDLVSEHGMFDERLERLVDWDLLLRYTADDGALAIPCVLSTYRYGKSRRQLSLDQALEPSLERIRRNRAGPVCRPRGLDRVCNPPILTAPMGSRRTAHRSRPVHAIVPSYEVPHYLRLCVESLRETAEDALHTVTLVDNGSGPDTRDALADLERHDGVEIVRNSTNLGFSHAVNQGLERVQSETDILIVNNDAVATPGWLQGFRQVLDLHPDTGLVVPRQVLPPGTATLQVHVPFSRTEFEADVSLSAHHSNVLDPEFDTTHSLMELTFAPFFCVYLPWETYAIVGSLDAERNPHYRSDRIYCDLVRHYAEKPIVYTPHAKFYHFLQQSTDVLRHEAPFLYEAMYVHNDSGRIASVTRAIEP